MDINFFRLLKYFVIFVIFQGKLKISKLLESFTHGNWCLSLYMDLNNKHDLNKSASWVLRPSYIFQENNLSKLWSLKNGFLHTRPIWVHGSTSHIQCDKQADDGLTDSLILLSPILKLISIWNKLLCVKNSLLWSTIYTLKTHISCRNISKQMEY